MGVTINGGIVDLQGWKALTKCPLSPRIYIILIKLLFIYNFISHIFYFLFITFWLKTHLLPSLLAFFQSQTPKSNSDLVWYLNYIHLIFTGDGLLEIQQCKVGQKIADFRGNWTVITQEQQIGVQISCLIKSMPYPKVTWYFKGEELNFKNSTVSQRYNPT